MTTTGQHAMNVQPTDLPAAAGWTAAFGSGNRRGLGLGVRHGSLELERISARAVIAMALCVALSGCANIDLSNRASRTLACDEVHVTSKWGRWLGITTVLDKRDAAALLKDCKAADARG